MSATELPAGLSIVTAKGQSGDIGQPAYVGIVHDGTGRWLPMHFGDDERLVPLMVPHLQGIDWTVNPDELTEAERQAWMDSARAAAQAAHAAVTRILTRWEYAHDDAAWEACDERNLCRACAEPYGDDVDAHLDECDGNEALDAEMIEAKLGLKPPAIEIPAVAS